MVNRAKKPSVVSIDDNEDNSNNKEANNYVLVSVSDPTNFTEVYNTELHSHTKLYQDNLIKKDDLKGKWKALVGAEEEGKRSRFYKNYQRLMKQTSSGIEQVLERIEQTGELSDSVYSSAINEKELLTKFPNAVYTEDPYTPEQKIAMHEAILGDGAVKRGISFWRKFLMGKEILAEFSPRKVVDDESQSQTVSERMSHHPDVIKYRNKLREIDDEVKLREAVQANCDNLFGFGRCCFVKLENDVGYTVRLVPLSSYKLGKVWIDALTFEFLGVEYLEIKSQENKNILLASDIVYLAINDNNVSPNTRYYGNSLIFPVLSISETNRINRERNFPEIIRKKWSATLVIKTSTKNPAKNQQIVDMVNNRAGGTVAIPDLVSAENIKTDTELQGLIQYAIETDKKIFRDMELPLIASGLEESSVTRTAAQSEIHVWAESTLEDLRENVTDMLREQWYHPNLKRIIEEDVVMNGTETNFVVEEPVLEETLDTTDVGTIPPTSRNTATATTDITSPTDSENAQTTTSPEEQLTLLEKLGFDLNSLEVVAKQVENTDPETLRKMVMEKLARIYIDVYQGIVDITQDDVISLSDQIKYPWKVYLKFKNIIFDNFLDRAAGVVGLLSAGVINEEIALELSKLDQYKQQMREAKMQEEQSQLKQMQTEMNRMRGELLAANNANGNNNNNQPLQLQRQNTENGNGSQNQQNDRASNPTDIGSSINRKIASRTNRGRVGN
jgi:hypothetical protein